MVKNQNFIVNILLTAVSLFILISAMQIDLKGSHFISSPRILPLLLSLTMFILSIANLIVERNKSAKIILDNKWFFAGFIIITFVYVALLEYIHFYLLTFLYLVFSFLYFRAGTLVRNIAVAAIFVIASYMIFEKAFRVIFPA
jgi:hypothetical protein